MEFHDIKTIFEDDDILVLEKPSGLVVNTSQSSPTGTLQAMLKADGGDDVEEDPETQSEFSQRGGIVHRIDKDTSGVLLIAKNETSFVKLQKQFKDRTIKKKYVALVLGEVLDKHIEIDAPLQRNPRNRTKMAVLSGGKPAHTRVETIRILEKGGENMTLVNAFPTSGRTHQIRVHLAAINHPVMGDPIYMTKSQISKWGVVFPRLMLHAEELTFEHPSTGKPVTFTSKLPPEFEIL